MQASDLFNGRHGHELQDYTVISATDGNHGRSLAAAARSIGCRCVIVLHAQVSVEREAAIAGYGADIVRIAGNYDESVQEAARLAAAHGWQVVSDTSYDGYEEVPRDVMQEYGTIAAELAEQTRGETCPFTHVFLKVAWAAWRPASLATIGNGMQVVAPSLWSSSLNRPIACFRVQSRGGPRARPARWIR